MQIVNVITEYIYIFCLFIKTKISGIFSEKKRNVRLKCAKIRKNQVFITA